MTTADTPGDLELGDAVAAEPAWTPSVNAADTGVAVVDGAVTLILPESATRPPSRAPAAARPNVEEKLRRPEYAQVRQSLSEIGFNSAIDLFSRFAAQGPMLNQWLADAQVNRDRNLRLQYLAGLGVNAYEQATIYSQMISYRQWPANLFRGSEETLAQLRSAMTWNQ